jgi:hypothetical protein
MEGEEGDEGEGAEEAAECAVGSTGVELALVVESWAVGGNEVAGFDAEEEDGDEEEGVGVAELILVSSP